MENKIIEVKRKPIKCPVCSFRPVGEILYGYPMYDQELQKEVEEGRTVLGGCEVSYDSPQWACKNCETKFHREKISLEDYFENLKKKKN